MVIEYKNEGIDKEILFIQNEIDKGLTDWGRIKVYGRVFKKDSYDKNVPQVYNIHGEYEQVGLDENDAVIFFIDSDQHDTNDGFEFSADIKIVCLLNLKNLFGERNEFEAHFKLTNILKRSKSNFVIDSLEKTANKVMSGFSMQESKIIDTYPCHLFSLNGTINYYLSKCNGKTKCK